MYLHFDNLSERLFVVLIWLVPAMPIAIILVFIFLYIFMLDRLFRFWLELATIVAVAFTYYAPFGDSPEINNTQTMYNYAKEYATLNERNSMYLANNKYADRDWYSDYHFHISAASRGYNEFYNCDHAQVSTGESVPMDDSSEGNEDGYGSFRSAEFLDY